MLRKKGVVGKFVEFYGTGLSSLTLPDRATIANMAPEYGATMGFFPVDAEVLNYLRFTDRSDAQINLVEAYTRNKISSAPTKRPIRFSPTSSNSISPPSFLPWQAPSVRRTAFRYASESGLHKIARPNAPKHAKRAEQWRYIRSRRRLRRHRRHHQLHQHFESVAHAWRRTSGEKSGRARPHRQALGENQLRSRLESRHRLHRKSRTLALSRSIALPSRRLRLHHLHRQQRPAFRIRSAKPSRTIISSLSPSSVAIATSRAASTHSVARTISLRRRWSLLTPSPAAWISISSTSRSATTNPASPFTFATSGRRRRSGIHHAQLVTSEMFRKEYADVFTGDEHWRALPDPRRRSLRLGRQIDLHQESAVLRRHAGQARCDFRSRGLRALARARRQHHHRSHFSRRLHSGRQSRREISHRSRRPSLRISIPTARAAAITK